MNVIGRIAFLFSLVFLVLIPYVSYSIADDAVVHIFPAPAGEALSGNFTVTVDNQNVPVYVAKVMAIQAVPEDRLAGEAAFASFDINATVKVVVTYSKPIQSARIVPMNSGIRSLFLGNQITFNVSKPARLTLEINGDWMNSLHLFINPFETNIPRPDDPNVIYFGPGVHHIGPVKVVSGKTVYIAGGAVIYGKEGFLNRGSIFTLEGSDIVLRGRGIIDGSLISRRDAGSTILKVQGQNIKVEGVILRDSGSWTFPIYLSNRVNVSNIKIFGWRDNSDGIDIVNSRNVEVNDSFLRTFDDLIVIKSVKKGNQSSGDILIKHNVLWNEIAHALSLGAELQENIDHVVFSDCDIIHDKGREWLLRVFNSDSGSVRHIIFDNIRIEEARRLMSLWIGEDMWSKDDERGHIDDVTFSNIQSVVPEQEDSIVELTGFDPEHAIHGVRFKNVIIGGNPLQFSDTDQNQFVQDVIVEP